MAGFIEARSGRHYASGWPARLIVRGQSEARRLFAAIDPTHVLSLKAPGLSYLGPRDLAPDRHLILKLDDVDDPAAIAAPNREHVAAARAFADGLPADSRLLIHGLQGVGRAPAMAIGLLAALLPPNEAVAAARAGCSQPPSPNRLLIALFDEELGLGGALVEACNTRFVPGSGTLRRRGDQTSTSFAFDMLEGGEASTDEAP
ncbi:phosphatase [Aurantimonas aggregata]|uniref:Phosphatase n=1 Tax=Aurantimonas aggregata TaxID=2047720 RepID=A0A6L9MHS0_9HYPH|nr:phosphatase [Aurantimonas aggregata]NDV87355.1 phosphatase [Aurantimonas aggregata]